MDKDITNIRHLMLPVHHKDCLVSRFLLENVNTVELSLTKCWHDGHLVAESRLLHVDTVLDFTWGLGPANWLQLPHSADGCLLSRVLSSKAMIISNPLCLQWTFQFCQLFISYLVMKWCCWNMEHSHYYPLRPARKSQCWCLETCWSFCWNVVNVPA